MPMEYVKSRAGYALKPLILGATFLLTAETLPGQEYMKRNADAYARQRQAQMQAYRQQMRSYNRSTHPASPRYIVKLRPEGMVVIDTSGNRNVATYHRFSRQTPRTIIVPDRNNPSSFNRIDQRNPSNPAVATRYNFWEELGRAKHGIGAWWQRNIR